MNFRFTDEQLLIRNEVRSLLEKSWTGREIRASAHSPEPAQAIARQLAGLGVRGITVPEEFGGLGGNELDLVLVLEEYGRAAVPDSIGLEAAVAVPILAEAGGAFASRWLPAAAAGEARLSIAFDQGYAVDADVADLVVLIDGSEISAAARDAVQLVQLNSVDDARRIFKVASTEWQRLTPAPGAGATASLRFNLAAAATLLGLAGRMLDMAVDHAKSREQFGQPIGAFQGVKFRLADAKTAVELARPVVYAAAWSLASAQPDAAIAVALARLFANRAADSAGRHSLQVHGGSGFAAEHDLNLYLKRAKALELAAGGSDAQLETLAVHLGV